MEPIIVCLVVLFVIAVLAAICAAWALAAFSELTKEERDEVRTAVKEGARIVKIFASIFGKANVAKAARKLHEEL